MRRLWIGILIIFFLGVWCWFWAWLVYGSPGASGNPPAGSSSAIWQAREVVVSPRPTLPAPPIVSDRQLYDAIFAHESVCGTQLVGDGGKSLGPFHICRDYWRDACKHAGLDWSYDRWVMDRDRSEYLMHAYWSRYGAVTYEEMARCHNSGSKWRQKYHLTNDYWRKVQRAMQ